MNDQIVQLKNDTKKMNRMSVGDSEGNTGARGRDAVVTAMATGGSSNANSRRGDSRPKKSETAAKSSQRALQE